MIVNYNEIRHPYYIDTDKMYKGTTFPPGDIMNINYLLKGWSIKNKANHYEKEARERAGDKKKKKK